MTTIHSGLVSIGLAGMALACTSSAPGGAAPQDVGFPHPTPAQLAWQEAELGVLISYDLHVFDEKHYNQRLNRKKPVESLEIFEPAQLDTDQWVSTAKAMGARFAILTASHETGFRLWQSDANPYCLKAVKWGDGKRDIVEEFVASCRKYGIKPGIYLGTRWNSHLGVWNFRVTERSPLSQAQYNDLIEKEVAEICSRYGQWFEVWFDGGAFGPEKGGPDVLSVFKRCKQKGVFYHNHERADVRWGGSESGRVPYPCWATLPFQGYSRFNAKLQKSGFSLLKHGDPEGKVWSPAMSDAPLRKHEWFWDAGDDPKVRSLKSLVNMYYGSVGRNSTLIVGLTPDRRGLIPDVDVKRCREFGTAIARTFSSPISSTSGHGEPLELDLQGSRIIDHVVLQEDIAQGERVRQYSLEVHDSGRWRVLAEGTCIGHKRIHHFAARPADRLRLRIPSSLGDPRIKTLAAYGPAEPRPLAQQIKYQGVVLRDPGFHVWGSSPIIGPEGKIHLFSARWPVTARFDPGWRTHSEIAHYVADKPEGPFVFQNVALVGTGKDSWDRFGIHNPAIHRVGDRYVLLYIGNDGRKRHPANQRIGMATARSLSGPWRRIGRDGQILAPSTDPKHWTFRAANGVNNPAFLQHRDGRFLLYYKSSHGRMGLAVANRLEGPYVHQKLPVTKNAVAIEDGYAFYWDNRICLITTDNHGIKRRGGGLLWQSKDGLAFDPDPTLAFGLLTDYVSPLPKKSRHHYGRGPKFERPQVLMRENRPDFIYLPSGTNIEGGSGSIVYLLEIAH